MALSTPTALGTPQSGQNATSLSVTGVSPTGGALLIVEATVTDNGSDTLSIADTLTGTGTWTQVTLESSSFNVRTSIFYAVAGATPGTGNITVSRSDTAQRFAMAAHEVTGQDTTTPVPQSKTIEASGSSTVTVTLDSSPAADSMVLGALGSRGGTAVTSGSGFLELVDVAVGSPSHLLGVQYDLASADTTCDWTSAGTTMNIAVAIEIAAAAEGGDTTPQAVDATTTVTADVSMVVSYKEAIAATSTVTADVATKSTFHVAIAAAATITPAITKKAKKIVAATTTVAPAISKGLSMAIEATTTITAVVAERVSYLETIAATTTITAAVAARGVVRQAVAATTTITAAVARSVSAGRTAAALTTITAAVGKKVFKNISATTTITADVEAQEEGEEPEPATRLFRMLGRIFFLRSGNEE